MDTLGNNVVVCNILLHLSPLVRFRIRWSCLRICQIDDMAMQEDQNSLVDIGSLAQQLQRCCKKGWLTLAKRIIHAGPIMPSDDYLNSCLKGICLGNHSELV